MVRKERLTDLSHVHVFDGVLFFGFFICGQMNGTKATFANFLVHCVVIENSAVIEVLPCTEDSKREEVLQLVSR